MSTPCFISEPTTRMLPTLLARCTARSLVVVGGVGVAAGAQQHPQPLDVPVAHEHEVIDSVAQPLDKRAREVHRERLAVPAPPHLLRHLGRELLQQRNMFLKTYSQIRTIVSVGVRASRRRVVGVDVVDEVVRAGPLDRAAGETLGLTPLSSLGDLSEERKGASAAAGADSTGDVGACVP